ncbi:MAG: hypothetical protein ACYS32_14020 [Planctomycetota bacterium]
MIRTMGTRNLAPQTRKFQKTSRTGHGGAHDVIIVAVAGLDCIQAHPEWEMMDYAGKSPALRKANYELPIRMSGVVDLYLLPAGRRSG